MRVVMDYPTKMFNKKGVDMGNKPYAGSREGVTLKIQQLRAERDRINAEVNCLVAAAQRLKIVFSSIEFPEPVAHDFVDGFVERSMIVDSSRSIPCVSGVYFLIKGGEIVYVGQSTNIFCRIGGHLQTKDIDGFSYIECPVSDLDFLESVYIHKFMPRLNGRPKKASSSFMICAPMSLASVADEAARRISEGGV